MQFLPGTHANQAVIQPDTFDAPIEVTGLSAEVLTGLFHGTRSARAHWQPGLQLTAGLAGQSESPDSAVHEQNLEDGRAMLRSGRPGTVTVERDHQLSEELLQPQSLYLLLAQQWARAGLMLVHGAAFKFHGRGILALGSKGAGKSVLTAAVLAGDGQVVSDDWVMVGLDRSGRLRAERLREFLMLRHGQACDMLISRLQDLKSAPLSSRPKTIFHFRDQPESVRAQCIPACEISQVWLLKRPPSGRFQPSARSEATPVQALAALIQATMPLLYSRSFALETARLRMTMDKAFDANQLYTVRTGPDLIEHPAKVMAALL